MQKVKNIFPFFPKSNDKSQGVRLTHHTDYNNIRNQELWRVSHKTGSEN